MSSFYTYWSSNGCDHSEEDIRLGERYSREELRSGSARVSPRLARCVHDYALRYCGTCRRSGL